MAFPKSKAVVELGLFIVVVALFIAAPIVYLLVQKYGLFLAATQFISTSYSALDWWRILLQNA
jgi:hypothetical protein